MKTLLVGIGAAGNKAVMEAINMGSVNTDDTLLINSTSKDFPKEYTGKTVILTTEDSGCGKERKVGREYAISAIKSGKLNFDNMNQYTTVMIVTSVEGGTGSGSTPVIADFFNRVYNLNVHVVSFIGFGDDTRGLRNTVEFFKELKSNYVVHAISNSSYLDSTKNIFKAEMLANKEVARRYEILTGKNFVASGQNIDDTDILKVSNTSGYTTVEFEQIREHLIDQTDFNKYVKRMLMESHSLIAESPQAIRIGIILNVSPASEDAIDYSFKDIYNFYGNPYERYLQKQWDESQGEYIAIIASGMNMPLDSIEKIYKTYKDQTSNSNKLTDTFYAQIQEMDIDAEDSKFDMIKPISKQTSVQDFLADLETGN